MKEKLLIRRIRRMLPRSERLRKQQTCSQWTEHGPFYLEEMRTRRMIASGIDDLDRLLSELMAEK